MKLISLHLTEELHRELKEVARLEGRPVAAVIREAMSKYVERARQGAHSVLDLRPFDSGKILEPWNREDIQDELLGRR